ncbi:hypothetical protein CVT26_007941 [Gymnopilus dilepis]|uniref:DUF6534 domain-containing protein n=1 Tax=Gymnopilus dilepis TaxID=231916 RepID=A0A409W7N2_9AGAR|nr:hypothetical protein CVT26_007941 [Gymnopilus dilepis]
MAPVDPAASASASPFAAVFAKLAVPLLSSLQLGALITWGLQGILCVQVYNYYLSFPNDPLHMKLLVYASLSLEILQTVLVTHDTYLTFAKMYGNLMGLDNLHYLWLTLPIMGGLVGLFCHLTFAYRIALLSESKIVGGVIAVLALSASVSAFTFGGQLLHAAVLSKLVVVKNIYLTCGLWNGSGALCDVFIAACMTYFLSKSQTGFRNTDVLITRIVRLSVETGAITGENPVQLIYKKSYPILSATASICSAVLFVGFREKLDVSVYFVIPAIMITKLYAITILATFNNRPHAVGGPPPLPDNDNSFEENKTYSRNLDRMTKEIRIGRTVVQQVWKDEVPLARFQVYGDDTLSIGNSVKDDDGQSSDKAPESITSPSEQPVKF